MLLFYILITIVPLLGVGIYFLVNYLNVTRYYSFIKKHSIALRKIDELNNRYVFKNIYFPSVNHTYDNTNFYNLVSCEDYLIYQLQFPDFKDKIFDAIKKVNENKKEYQDYLDNYNLYIKPGQFDVETGKLKLEKLLALEKEELDRKMPHPTVIFKITVVLRNVNMGGAYLSSKKGCFGEEGIRKYLSELKNKEGNFYKSEFIWGAISRVERARVTNKMRFYIYKRDHYTCRMCHRKYAVENLEIDHIYPIAKGGKSNYENLQTLCKWCNKKKGDSVL